MVRLTDRPDMILDVYLGRKTTTTKINFSPFSHSYVPFLYLCPILGFPNIFALVFAKFVFQVFLEAFKAELYPF